MNELNTFYISKVHNDGDPGADGRGEVGRLKWKLQASLIKD